MMTFLPPPNPHIAGAALSSERGFFGREDILREVERTLRRPNDNAIVLYGQRRIGKTSILLQLQRRLPAPPFVPIYFDLMDKARLPIHQVLCELAVTAAAEVGLPPLEKADFRENPEAFHHILLPEIYKALGDERRPVFLLDEFDVLDIADERSLPETAAARAFRPYLRRLMTTETRLAFVFVVGRRMEELSVEFLSTFKAALSRPVSVLPPEQARELVLYAEREGALRYEEAAVERILALTQGHPYLTQLTCQILFDRAFDLSPGDMPLITAGDVESVILNVLEAGSNAFQWIWDGLPPAERIIFSAIASHAEEGKILSEDDITAILQEAGIRILVKELNLAPQTLVSWQMLEQVDGSYRFFVELMRRWVAAKRPLDQVKDELDRINPLADTLYQAAQGFYRQGNNEQAVAQLRQALEANPNHLKARLLLGTILQEGGRLADAVTEFEEVYRLDEREGRFELLRTLLQQGEALETAGDEEGALVAYDRVLAISPREQTAQARRAALWEKRGDRVLAAGDYTAAIEAYRQAGADEKLGQVKAQKLKIELERAAEEAEAYEIQEEWSKAVDVYQRLAELAPDDERWQQALRQGKEELWLAERYAEGAGYVQQEEWNKAQKTLARVITKRPDYRDAAELLALAKQRRAGQPDSTVELRRRLRLAVIGGVALLLLAVAGVWAYSQIQIQNQAAHLAATVTAQAIAAETAAATRVAVALQSTQLAELRVTQTAGARATQTSEVHRTATAETAARAARTTEAQYTATAAAIATQTAQSPTTTLTPTRTPSPTTISTTMPTPTPTNTPTPTSTAESSGDFVYAAPTDLSISPAGGDSFSFDWVWDGSLKDNEFFELRIWSGDGPHWGGAEPTKASATTVDMFILARGDADYSEPGFFKVARDAARRDLMSATSFCASIAVITKEPYTSLSPESNVVCWNWP